MRLHALLLFSLLFMGCGSYEDFLAPSPGSDGDWIPLGLKHQWGYQRTTYTTSPDPVIRTDSLRLVRDSVIHGVHWFQDEFRPLDHYARLPDGYYLARAGKDGWEDAERLIRIPIRRGDTIFEWISSPGPLAIANRYTYHLRILDAVDVPVTVPLGTYRCLRTATYETTRDSRWPGFEIYHIRYRYYALHVGLVRTEVWSWSSTSSRALESVDELAGLLLRLR